MLNIVHSAKTKKSERIFSQQYNIIYIIYDSLRGTTSIHDDTQSHKHPESLQ